MQIRDLGEFGLIDRIARLSRRVQGRGVVIGIGDDAAVLRPTPGEDVVISTDTLVEDVHFRWRQQSARSLGRRALVVNLSDLAAMGARPMAATLALALPPKLPVKSVLDLVRGFLDEGERYGCPLVGGNLTRAREVSLAVTVLGRVRPGRALCRSDARVGDRIFVTGTLGAAALALHRSERTKAPLRRVPTPRLAAGRALAGLPTRGACIDVSDGLLADLDHLLVASRVGAKLDTGAVPRPRGFARACAELGVAPDTLALTGGEDYELLFTLRPTGPGPRALSSRLGVGVTEVGEVTPRPRSIKGSKPLGWRHF